MALNKKAEELSEDNFVYVFVNLNGLEQLPDYYIVPSKYVAEHIQEEHQKWLNTPGKKGQDRNDTDMRMFRDDKDEFKNKWDVFGTLLRQ
jgi:hypothetical protein